MQLADRINKIISILEEKRAEDVTSFDLHETEYFAKAVVIATTLVDRHAYALLDDLKRALKPEEEFLRVEDSKDWIILDMGDIIVHLMSKPSREKFNLEEFLSNLR